MYDLFICRIKEICPSFLNSWGHHEGIHEDIMKEFMSQIVLKNFDAEIKLEVTISYLKQLLDSKLQPAEYTGHNTHKRWLFFSLPLYNGSSRIYAKQPNRQQKELKYRGMLLSLSATQSQLPSSSDDWGKRQKKIDSLILALYC